MASADQRRRQFTFTKNRSLSAPTRKRWYNSKGSHYYQNKDTLYDRVLAQKLAEAIEMWHEFHMGLSQLSLDREYHRKSSDGNLEEKIENLEGYEGTASWIASQGSLEEEDLCEEDEDFSESDEEASSSGSIDGEEKIKEILDDTTTSESLDTIEEIAKFEKKAKLNGKLSISNPDLTNIQLKSILPKLQRHWK